MRLRVEPGVERLAAFRLNGEHIENLALIRLVAIGGDFGPAPAGTPPQIPVAIRFVESELKRVAALLVGDDARLLLLPRIGAIEAVSTRSRPDRIAIDDTLAVEIECGVRRARQALS